MSPPRLLFVLGIAPLVAAPALAAVWHDGGMVRIETPTCRALMSAEDGLLWQQIWVRSPRRQVRLLGADGGPVLQLAYRPDDGAFASWYSTECDVEVAPGDQGVRISLRPPDEGAPEVELLVSDDGRSEVLFEVSVTSQRDGEIMLALPILDGVFSDQQEQVTYFYPRDSGILNSRPVDLASAYGQYVRMQVIAASVPEELGASSLRLARGMSRSSLRCPSAWVW